jgi:hypothetical protein
MLLTSQLWALAVLAHSAEFGDVFATGISEVADDVMPGDIYCCVERIHVSLHTSCGANVFVLPQYTQIWQQTQSIAGSTQPR